MPVSGDVYIQRSAEDITEFLEAELQAEYGLDIDLTESSAFSTFANAIGTLDADEIEGSLEEVFKAAYLEDAEGDLLDKVVAILGIQRQSAVHATGTVEFQSDDTVTQSHAIENGQQIETDSDQPVTFETSERVDLFLRDDFESGSLDSSYAGDTGDFSVVDGTAGGDPSPENGSYELKGDAASGSQIFQDTITSYIGHTMDFYVYAPTNTIPMQLFGVSDGDNYYRIQLDTSAGSHKIQKKATGTVSDLTTNSVSIPNGEWLRNEIEWSPDNDGTITSRIYEKDGSGGWTLVDEISAQDNAIEDGGFGFASGDATDNKYWDLAADRAVEADARAVEGGPDGNVGAGSLTITPSVPSGVDNVTNRHPMGDSDFYLTNLTNFDTGQDEESDTELRERAQVSEGARGDATIPAVIAALRELPDVQSITLFENKQDSASGGLPATSFEAVIFGTAGDQDIADQLFSVKGLTAEDVGGVNGTEITKDVEAENGQTFTMHWSEPTEVTIDMTLDLVVDDTYIGDEALRNRIVDYIGGTDSDGAEIIGTGVGEDVYIHQLQDAVVGPDDTGVIGIDESGSSYTPSTTTDSNNLDVISVSSSEVATTNAEDGSITINTTVV